MEVQLTPPRSEAGWEVRQYVCGPIQFRKPVGYNRSFVDEYRPNVTFYLSQAERAELLDVGKSEYEELSAGTHAKKIFERLLIDLSWNSSRLEGNTYSLLDTEQMIEAGKEAQVRNDMKLKWC